MHRSRSWRSRAERLGALMMSLWTSWAIWAVVWYLAHWMSYWEFTLVGAVFVVTTGKISERARNVRRAQSRMHVWVLPPQDVSHVDQDQRGLEQ